MRIFDEIIDDRTLVLDVAAGDCGDVENVAETLASMDETYAKVTWDVEYGFNNIPVMRFDAVESIGDQEAHDALLAIYRRYNGLI